MQNSVLAVITNYAFSENADKLKANLAPYFETILIDSSSPSRPKNVDIVLPNLFYTGLWNESVRLASVKNKEWLLFVASDVEIPSVQLLYSRIQTAVNNDRIGIYTPSLRCDSRAAFGDCYNQRTSKLRECYLCEGFFFLARTKILEKVYPVSTKENEFGWGIDILSAYYAYKEGLRVVVDDQVEIYHPSSIHPISIDEAQKQVVKYLRDNNAYRFYRYSRRLLKYKRRIARITKHIWS